MIFFSSASKVKRETLRGRRRIEREGLQRVLDVIRSAARDGRTHVVLSSSYLDSFSLRGIITAKLLKKGFKVEDVGLKDLEIRWEN